MAVKLCTRREENCTQSFTEASVKLSALGEKSLASLKPPLASTLKQSECLSVGEMQSLKCSRSLLTRVTLAQTVCLPAQFQHAHEIKKIFYIYLCIKTFANSWRNKNLLICLREKKVRWSASIHQPLYSENRGLILSYSFTCCALGFSLIFPKLTQKGVPPLILSYLKH